ncbi:hypothetical protein DFH11DRAFT_1773445 [Phellopilus nigrolimitatus]|nr:hypothetical protein DFH11DRAFT_1773445 [Phellopilus nigrolimitatus]
MSHSEEWCACAIRSTVFPAEATDADGVGTIGSRGACVSADVERGQRKMAARGNNTIQLPHIVENSSARKGGARSRQLIRENEVDPGVHVLRSPDGGERGMTRAVRVDIHAHTRTSKQRGRKNLPKRHCPPNKARKRTPFHYYRTHKALQRTKKQSKGVGGGTPTDPMLLFRGLAGTDVVYEARSETISGMSREDVMEKTRHAHWRRNGPAIGRDHPLAFVAPHVWDTGERASEDVQMGSPHAYFARGADLIDALSRACEWKTIARGRHSKTMGIVNTRKEDVDAEGPCSKLPEHAEAARLAEECAFSPNTRTPCLTVFLYAQLYSLVTQQCLVTVKVVLCTHITIATYINKKSLLEQRILNFHKLY